MREMEGGEGRNINNIISSLSHSHNNQVGLDEMQQSQDHQHQQQQQQQFQDSSNDDFLNQMLSNISNCSWPPTPHDIPSPSSNNPNTSNNNNNNNNPSGNNNPTPSPTPNNIAGLQQMNEVTAKSLLLQHQQQFLMSRRPPGDAPPELLPSLFKSPGAAEASVQALYNGFAGSLQPPNQQHFHPPPPPPPQGGNMGGGPNFGGQGAAINQAPPASAASTGGSSGGAAPQRQRVRARRGQATDPHSIAERLRRERIAERMKGLQELVPNANKTDKASMLDEIIDYVKFLQLQVKVLSMSRLGGAAAVAPRVADLTSEEGGVGRGSNANQTTPPNDSMTVTEHQVAKLMEEDMGSAMQYLQGKGLCLMPISLATAISTATSITRTPLPPPRPHITNNVGAHHDITNNHHPLLPCISPSNDEGDNNANAMSITPANPNSDPSLKDP